MKRLGLRIAAKSGSSSPRLKLTSGSPDVRCAADASSAARSSPASSTTTPCNHPSVRSFPDMARRTSVWTSELDRSSAVVCEVDAWLSFREVCVRFSEVPGAGDTLPERIFLTSSSSCESSTIGICRDRAEFSASMMVERSVGTTVRGPEYDT